MSLDFHYKTLLTRAEKALSSLVLDAERLPAFTAVHNFGAEFEVLISALKSRPECAIFDLALREFYYSLYICATGSYRHAHTVLRSFLELFAAGVFFSAYEIKLRSWLSGLEGSDISWSAIVSPDSGIFSTTFLNAFHPGLAESGKQYRTLAITAYRECSEFVHGNINTQDLDASPFNYNSNLLTAWIERVEAIRLCLLFSFAGRYLPLLDRDAQAKVEFIMLENFGHLPAIQTVYG